MQLIILSMEGSSYSETAGAIESVGVNGSDRVWSAIIRRVIIESGTHMAVGNQRAALINKQLDGVRPGLVRPGEARRGEAGRGGASHITLSYILTQSLNKKVCTACRCMCTFEFVIV